MGANEHKSTRRKIENYVYSHPGVHFNDLVRELDLATGQVQYHIRRLTNSRSLVESHHYGRTHYYPPSFDNWERGVLALIRRETAREILFYLLEWGPCKPRDIVSDLPIARSTLEWQIDRLIEQGIVEKHHGAHNLVTFSVIETDRILELLDRITPTVTDQLTDRFLRLVDDVFENR